MTGPDLGAWKAGLSPGVVNLVAEGILICRPVGLENGHPGCGCRAVDSCSTWCAGRARKQGGHSRPRCRNPMTLEEFFGLFE